MRSRPDITETLTVSPVKSGHMNDTVDCDFSFGKIQDELIARGKVVDDVTYFPTWLVTLKDDAANITHRYHPLILFSKWSNFSMITSYFSLNLRRTSF
jgi:hypothetical protein